MRALLLSGVCLNKGLSSSDLKIHSPFVVSYFCDVYLCVRVSSAPC